FVYDCVTIRGTGTTWQRPPCCNAHVCCCASDARGVLLSSPLNTQTTVLSVAVGCFLAPFAEEVFFRGYMFGQLYRRARWGFWFSAILQHCLRSDMLTKAVTLWNCLGSLLSLEQVGC